MPTVTWWFIGAACGQLLLAAGLLRTRSRERRGGGTDDPPPPQALALLRGGRRAAVTVALVALHQRGAVAAGRRHTIRANGGPGRTLDPLQLGVHTALHRAFSLRDLTQRPEARRPVDALGGELREAGLLRSRTHLWAARALLGCVPVTVLVGAYATGGSGTAPAGALTTGALPVLAAVVLLRLPSATPAARRLLAGLRERYPLPAHRREVTDGKLVQLYVALYGDPALTLFLPRFSRDGGLLDRPRETDGFRPPDGPGGDAGPDAVGGPR